MKALNEYVHDGSRNKVKRKVRAEQSLCEQVEQETTYFYLHSLLSVHFNPAAKNQKHERDDISTEVRNSEQIDTDVFLGGNVQRKAKETDWQRNGHSEEQQSVQDFLVGDASHN